MTAFSVTDIVAATAAEALVEGEASVTHTVIDSRGAGPGALFVAFAGERVDGNAFARAAIEAGCACVCVTAEPDGGVVEAARVRGASLVRAAGDDGEEFLLRLAAAWRASNPQWIVVGVTGSVGKTTTKDMLAKGLAATRRVHATSGNFNNLIGLPLTLLSASRDDEVVVVEMGMNSTEEMPRLSACAHPDLSIITNIGTSHIGMLGSREAIARAKAEIVSGMRVSSSPVQPRLLMGISNDFAELIEREYARPAGVTSTYVGVPGTLAWAEKIILDERGCPAFNLCFSDGWNQPVQLSTPGTHAVADFLLAMAAIACIGAERQPAVAAIGAMPQPHMRLEVLEIVGCPRIIDDSYNASPDSVAAALAVLCSLQCRGRRIAVLGEIGELGAESARLHGYVGAYAAAQPLDLLVLVGRGDIAYVAEAARTMGFPQDRLQCYPTVDMALHVLVPTLSEDDIVLAKGSRAAGLDAFVKGVTGHAG